MENVVSGKVERIIVRCPNWVGDIVMATPLFDCLRMNFPEAKMACVIRKYATGIVKGGPWFDEVLGTNDKNWQGFRELRSQVKRFKPDMAVVLPNSIRSVLPVLLAGTRNIYGYKRSGRSLIVKGPAPHRSNGTIAAIPMKDYYLEIGRWMGLDIPSQIKPRLYISSDTQRMADELVKRYSIADEDTVIGLNPGASFGSSKCWPVEHFARLAEMLQSEFQSKIMLFVGPGEDEIAEAIVAKSKADIIDTAPDRVDLDLLKPLIKRCKLLITNDTGPRHYGVAFDVPTVVLMGPTNPKYTQSDLDNSEVIRLELPCSPCHKKTCPEDHRCMRDITPEMVFEKSKELMQRRN
jgi:heptosyltransferase-2